LFLPSKSEKREFMVKALSSHPRNLAKVLK
jgi:hypothetical protein